jgi:hypothetical protein
MVKMHIVIASSRLVLVHIGKRARVRSGRLNWHNAITGREAAAEKAPVC